MCAPARAGKDTILPLLKRDLENKYGGNWHRHAFADKLRIDLEHKIKNKYGISIWDDSQKHLFRNDMIKYGEQKRRQTNNRYLVDDFINKHNTGNNYIITDFRFLNEYSDLSNYYGKHTIIPIYIERFIENKNGLRFVTQPVIPQEIEEYSKIKTISNIYCVPWEKGFRWKSKLSKYHFDI